MSGRPLRIVHCMRAPVGGLFRHVCDLARGQAERGHLVGIIADAATGGETAQRRFGELAAACKLGIERFAMSRLPGPGDLATSAKIARVVGSWDPDVLHGHGAKGGAYARISGTRLRGGGTRPVRVYTPHGGALHYSPTSPAGIVFLAAERWLTRRTDVFIFESEYGLATFRQRICEPPGIVRVVHNGLAPAEFAPVTPDDDAADFVFVGELRFLKGVDTLLEALALVEPGPNGPNVVIVGDGADRAGLVATAARLGLGSRVRFAGAMPARDAFRAGKCLVVPSRAESLPYVVLEAAAAEVPIIATNVGGIPEIFGAQAERLVPPDDPARLVEAMMRVLDAPEAAKAQADALATDVAQRFSLDRMADDAIDSYAAALDAGSHANR